MTCMIDQLVGFGCVQQCPYHNNLWVGSCPCSGPTGPEAICCACAGGWHGPLLCIASESCLSLVGCVAASQEVMVQLQLARSPDGSSVCCIVSPVVSWSVSSGYLPLVRTMTWHYWVLFDGHTSQGCPRCWVCSTINAYPRVVLLSW